MDNSPVSVGFHKSPHMGISPEYLNIGGAHPNTGKAVPQMAGMSPNAEERHIPGNDYTPEEGGGGGLGAGNKNPGFATVSRRDPDSGPPNKQVSMEHVAAVAGKTETDPDMDVHKASNINNDHAATMLEGKARVDAGYAPSDEYLASKEYDSEK